MESVWSERLRLLFQKVRGYYSSLEHLKSRPLGALAVAGLLDRMSIMMVVPFLPIYAEQFTNNYALIGFMFAAESITTTVLTIPAGYVSDKLNRKVLICTGMVLSAVGVVGIPFAGSIWILIGFRIIDGIGSAMRIPTIKAYLGDIVPKEERGSAMGAYRSVEMMGVVLGPAMGGTFAAVTDMRTPFIVLGSSTLVAAAILVVYLPVLSSDGSEDDEDDASSLFDASWSEFRRVLTKPVAALAIISLLTGLASGAFSPMLPLLLKSQMDISTKSVGIVWAVYGTAIVLAVPVGGTITDAYGRKPLVTIAYTMWIVVPVSLVVLSNATASVLVVGGVLFVAGLGSAISNAAKGPLNYEIPPENLEGTAMGLFSAAASVGTAGGPMWGGFIADYLSISFTFVAVALLYAVSLTLLFFGVPEPS